MTDHSGQVVRGLRKAAGLSLRALAEKSFVGKTHIDNIEKGERRLTLVTAKALDEALKTPILTLLVAAEGDDMQRRALLAHLGAIGAAPGTFAETIRLGLDADADADGVDWDEAVSDYRSRLVSDPSAVFGSSLLADIMLLRNQIKQGRPSVELYRAAAAMSQIYGLWLGNTGGLALAQRWYGSSYRLADNSRDTALRVWVRGRSLSRLIYESWNVAQTTAGVQEALALSNKPSPGMMEAYAALVSVHALTGDVAAGKAAVRDMFGVAAALDDPAATARVVFLDAFMSCRIDTLASAEEACEIALGHLQDWPLWEAETRVYLGRARVAHGDLSGISYALDTVRGLKHDVRVIGVAVRDLVDSVPAGYRSDELHALRGYAKTGTMPWQLT